MKKHSGFTLIELMMATVVFAIILTAAIPAFRSMMERESVPQVAKILEKAIQAARVQARSRSTTVILRPTNTLWNAGFEVIWVDASSNSHLLRQYPAVPNVATITSSDFSRANPLTFNPDGQAARTGSFSLTPSDEDSTSSCQYTLNVLISGMVQKRFSGC